jgi:hypothetical protein
MRMNQKWLDNKIQFPRLLAEIYAIGGLSGDQMRQLCDSMDLEPDEINQLFDRAQDEWDRIKARLPRTL